MSLNILEVAGRTFLYVESQRVHVAAEESSGRPAYHEHQLELARSRGYTRDAPELREPRWAERTLCGREWFGMAATAETRALDYWEEDEGAAPLCKRCLQILDRLFPQPAVVPAVGIVAQLAAEAIREWGSCQIEGVPGDQIEALRRAVRREVRAAGFRCTTLVHDSLVVAYSDEASERIPEANRQALDRLVRDALDDAATGADTAPADKPWHLRWRAWDV